MKAETKYVGTNAAGTAKFFEDFAEQYEGDISPKGLGVRLVETNSENRLLGVAGKRELTLTEPVTLLRCFKEVVLKASVKKPVKVVTYLYPLGRQ